MSGDGVIRVAVAGARGKMGRVAVDAFCNADGFTYVGGFARHADPQQRLYDDLNGLLARQHPDVLLDFTTQPASFEVAMAAVRQSVRPVVGASGWSDAQRDELDRAAQRRHIGAMIVANFSTGALLMMRFAQEAARYYDHAGIVEMHHLQKKDAPSATALETARRIAGDGRPMPAIQSLRLPGPTAHQEVRFGAPGEMLTIVHDTFGRESFVAGMLAAARAVMRLQGLAVGLEAAFEPARTPSST